MDYAEYQTYIALRRAARTDSAARQVLDDYREEHGIQPVPALPGWYRFGAGSKHGYGFYTKPLPEGGHQYSISPYSSDRGWHLGYLLSVFPGENHGHAGIAFGGDEVPLTSSASHYRTPQDAVAAARRHAASSPQRSRRRRERHR